MNKNAINSVWLGYDPKELRAFTVARRSIVEHAVPAIPHIYPIVLQVLSGLGRYWRPTTVVGNGTLWDLISNAPMSTEHALARFLVPVMAREYGVGTGWALFMDCDVLIRSNLNDLFRMLDPKYAVFCVKHRQVGTAETKMDGQRQQSYSRKWWSSVMAFNLSHSSNDKLDVNLVNSARGLDLHNFCWLREEEIGDLPISWNYLVGVTKPAPDKVDLAHFTLGTPDMVGYEDCEYSDEWRNVFYSSHRNRKAR